VMEGNFTIGMFTIFTSYFSMMLGSSRYFFSLGALYQNTMVAYDRISEILQYDRESQGNVIISDINRIDLRNVEFSYSIHPDSKYPAKRIINCLNASFTKGNIYAITGANGAGKSTLISLMLGMYIDEYTGSIAYDSVDIREIDMIATRKNLICFAEQEPQLINDTVRYNLFFPDEVESDISNIFLKHTSTLNMQDFLAEQGIDYIINEKNTNTSGGEKQKISILKVLCKNPPVMLFDEPSSALDASTIEKFMNYLNQIKKDKIIIIITHDETVKRWCDTVIKLEKQVV